MYILGYCVTKVQKKILKSTIVYDVRVTHTNIKSFFILFGNILHIAQFFSIE